MVYLPTWMVDFHGKCRLIYQSHGSSKIQSIWGKFDKPEGTARRRKSLPESSGDLQGF